MLPLALAPASCTHPAAAPTHLSLLSYLLPKVLQHRQDEELLEARGTSSGSSSLAQKLCV